MSNSVNYFMWGYQHAFQIHALVELREILNQLHSNFGSQIFLVGFLIEDIPNRLPVCISPDDFELQPSLFESVPEIAKEIANKDERSNAFCSDPEAGKIFYRGIENDAWRQALCKTIDENSTDEWKTFASHPVEVEGYKVFTVAQLNRKDIQRYYTLEKSTASESSINRSLLESTTINFLRKCSEYLTKPNPGKRFEVIVNRDELIREAGQSMMYPPAIAGGNREGLHGNFGHCDAISTMLYESSEGKGSILYIDSNHPNLSTDVLLRRKVPLGNHSEARKLLEISNEDVSLLCDSHSIYGLGSLSPEYDSSREDAFTVIFTRRFNWQLRHAGDVLMHVSYGLPALLYSQFPTSIFCDHLRRIFPHLDTDQVQQVLKLAECIDQQKHGAMLVIASDAKVEAERLHRQCTPVSPFKLTESNLPMMTTIDGSVLMDAECRCHALGVILDGLSHDKCTPARGSRYNSAVRYVYTPGVSRIAIVKSEDGMLNILPNLMPQISRQSLDSNMNRIREMSKMENGDVDDKEYSKTMDWLTEHRFYLSLDFCDELNKLWPIVQDKLQNKDGWCRQYQSFVPDPELDESYFL